MNRLRIYLLIFLFYYRYTAGVDGYKATVYETSPPATILRAESSKIDVNHQETPHATFKGPVTGQVTGIHLGENIRVRLIAYQILISKSSH